MKVKIHVVDIVKLQIQLEFRNNTQENEYLNKSHLYISGESSADQFHFEPREAVRYVGPIIKRVPFGEDDIITVGPAERYYTEVITLTHLYQINQRRKLKVRYHGSHPLDGLHKGSCTVESPWANLDNSWSAEYDFVMRTHGEKFGFA